jgi:hypothetical protein
MVRKEKERNVGTTYEMGWLVVVADGSRLCWPQSDCDDDDGTDLPGVGRRAWRETVVERETATKIGV